jgi:fumarate reductase flavoprotein subunit
MHGFNRLGGNSVAETIVMGMVVGTHVAQDLDKDTTAPSPQSLKEMAKDGEAAVTERMEKLKSGGTESVYPLRDRMSEILLGRVGVFRNGDDLKKGVDELVEVYKRTAELGLKCKQSGPNPEMAAALKLPGMVRLALSIAYGASTRTESRGSHYREDFPSRDDGNWLKRTLALWPEGAELPELHYEPVKITELPPGDRGYGESAVRKDDSKK